jgi:hypothetical protein
MMGSQSRLAALRFVQRRNDSAIAIHPIAGVDAREF